MHPKRGGRIILVTSTTRGGAEDAWLVCGNAMLVVRVDLSSGVDVLWQFDDNDDNDGDDNDPLFYMQ